MSQALRDRPVLEWHLQYYARVFAKLMDSRGYTSNGLPLPIPMTEYVAYHTGHGVVDLEERERIEKYVKELDSTYIKLTLAREEARRKTK